MWSSLNNYRDSALLFLRVALGSFYIYAHGWVHLAGGVVGWRKSGQIMKQLGVTFSPEIWGFLGAFSATLLVALLVIGFWFRPACLAIFCALAVVTFAAIDSGTVLKAHHAIEFSILTFSLLFIGPGRFSVDKS